MERVCTWNGYAVPNRSNGSSLRRVLPPKLSRMINLLTTCTMHRTVLRVTPTAIRSLPLVALAPTIGWTAACVTATSSCTEWISGPSNPSRLLVYRSHPLRARNEQLDFANLERQLNINHAKSAKRANFKQRLDGEAWLRSPFRTSDSASCSRCRSR